MLLSEEAIIWHGVAQCTRYFDIFEKTKIHPGAKKVFFKSISEVGQQNMKRKMYVHCATPGKIICTNGINHYIKVEKNESY